MPTCGTIAAKQVLFLNVGTLDGFEYPQIRKFAHDVLHILSDSAPLTHPLAMTIHGMGYGLDETDALRSQLAGYLDAFDKREYPPSCDDTCHLGIYPTVQEKLPFDVRDQRCIECKRIMELKDLLTGELARLSAEPM
jgi:hypothetical protein